MLKISLIIPVHNAAGSISQMLDSIAAQTMPCGEMELLIADDFSTDGSEALAEAWAEEHSRLSVKILHLDANVGPGEARNAALEQACGQYVVFVDADDRLAPTYCQALYDTAHGKGADMAWCRAQCTGRSSEILGNPPAGQGRSRLLRRFRTYLWTCIFRREFLLAQDISFPHTRCAEDSHFCLAALMAAGIAASTDEILYYYTVGDSSLSARPGKEKADDRLDSMRALRRWAKGRGFYGMYSASLEYVIFKKGFLLSAKDRYIK